MRGILEKDPGENRLSRLRHYHGPGGLNGRVRDGNGWCPARIVAGKLAGRHIPARRSDITDVTVSDHVFKPPVGWVQRTIWHMVRCTHPTTGKSCVTRVVAAFTPLHELMSNSRRGSFCPTTEPFSTTNSHWRRRVGVVKPLGCWDWSAEALTRRTRPAHRPGRLPGAFCACAHGSLVLEEASRLDAFSAYPVPTWLPGDAPSGTTGTPEVGPPQSSRTRGETPQASHAHGR